MDVQLLYVSRSALRLPAEAREVDAIVAWSRARNAALGVTGALVFTETHFAQYLEGPDASVALLMNSIRRDPRHADVATIYERPLRHHVFPTWALAYAGPSTFVAGHVLSVAGAGPGPAGLKAADRLVELMRQFVDAQLVEARRKSAS